MPPTRKPPTASGKLPSRRASASEDVNAAIERMTPDVLALLRDGVPRTKGTIIAALADRHPKDDVRRTLMRLAVTEQLVETDGKYILPGPAPETKQG
jgi:hypothetical protein